MLATIPETAERRTSPSRPNARSGRRRIGRADLILALGLLLCYGFFRQHPLWNEFSRYDLVQAIVDTGSPIIDAYHENTGDKAFYDGHYYSDKAPGSALLGVPVELALRAGYLLFGAPPPVPDASMHALAFAISGVPTVVLILLLLRFLTPAVGRRWALAVVLGYALGSMAFPFATMFFGHAASTAFLFASFYLVWRWRDDPADWRLLGAGALTGLAVITEIPVVLGAAIVALYAVWRARRRALLFVLGGLPLLGVLLAHNWIAFDNPLSLGYQYATAFAEQNKQGIVSIVWPSPATTVDLLLGPRGLLTYAPWLALAPLGLVALRTRLRAEVLVAAAMVVAFLTYNSGALNPFGGWTPGPRYLLPALPFGAILVALAPRAVRPLTLVLMSVSITIFVAATATLPNAPEAVHDPLRDVWLPRLYGRDLAESNAWIRWGLHGIQPFLVLLGGVLATGVGLLAAERQGERSRERRPRSADGGMRLTALVIATQLVLIAAFAAPLPPVTPLSLGQDPDERNGVVVIDGGIDRLPLGAPPGDPDRRPARANFWAQFQNAGKPLSGTRVRFSLATVAGREVWSGWFDDLDWQTGERKQIRITWKGDATAATYRVGVAITSPDGRTLFGGADDIGTLVVEPESGVNASHRGRHLRTPERPDRSVAAR